LKTPQKKQGFIITFTTKIDENDPRNFLAQCFLFLLF